MHSPKEESSPSSDFEFDQSEKYATAWDAAPSRKPRKQYGKTNSQKKEARRHASSRRKILRRSESAPLESGGSTIQGKALPFTRHAASITNDGSPDFGVRPSKFGRHLRSRSVSCLNPRKGTLKRANSLDHSSHSFSTLNAAFDLEHENHNPNLFSRAERSLFDSPPGPSMRALAPLTTMDEHPKARPRKIRAVGDVADLQQSFSNLAKDVDATTTWDDATPKNATSLAFDTLDFEITSSPHDSVATLGSRKRVCDSIGGSGDLMGSDVSSQGDRLRRSKSRSRIYTDDFAPMLESVRTLNDINPPKKKLERIRRRADSIDSSDDDCASSSDGGMSCDNNNDKSFEDFDDGLGPFEKRAVTRPPTTVRRSSTSSNFEACVFGATTARPTKVLSNECIVNSMPSLEDLRFLIKHLHKAEKSASKTFGKVTTWTVSLPSQWASERRAKLLHWSTRDLGFSVRTGGPSVVFLNIAASRAPTLLEQLESAFRSNRKTDVKSKSSSDVPPTIIFQPKPKPPSALPRGYRGIDNFESLDDELIQAVNKLDLSAQAPEPTTDESSRLVRLVTLEQNHGLAHVEDDMVHGPSRHSGDGVLDLVSHMHVESPRVGPPSFHRLSGGMPRLSIDIDSFCAASPFVPPRNSRSSYPPPAAECIETPHMTRRACWERPKNARDWGTSTRCSDEVLKELNSRFENALAEAGERLEDSSTSLFFKSAIDEANLDIDSPMEEGDEEDADTVQGDEEPDNFDNDFLDLEGPPQIAFGRRSSYGASAFAGMNLNEVVHDEEKVLRRRIGSMAKHKRVSLCTNTIQTRKSLRPSRSSYFSGAPRASLMDSTLTLTDSNRFSFVPTQIPEVERAPELVQEDSAMSNSKILLNVFSFLDEQELLCRALPVSTLWADVGTDAHATLMLSSVGCIDGDDGLDDDGDEEEDAGNESIMQSMEKSWKYLTNQYPWACFLSEGAFKKVYKVWNASTQAEEAISVMDIELIESTGNKNVVGAELAVSAMLSSLVRRNITPNFVLTRRVFTCPFEPPAKHWGSEDEKRPKGSKYSPSRCKGRKPREPSKQHRGKYQYMRMELCTEGDAEEYLKRQQMEAISANQARNIIFQIAFALHAAADRFSLKHYDMKLLNVFLQRPTKVDAESTTMRYGLGSHVFALHSPIEDAVIAKLADFGTANVQAESNGQPATIGQFTTLENTPPEFMILGDVAAQGHAHDAFGLGLCFLHLFTGHAPYEEILEDVKCPMGLKRKLQRVWENEESAGYSVIQSVILADVCKDEDGEVIAGEPDEVLYDTLYRFLVLFGVPEVKYKIKEHGRVWKAISSSLEGEGTGKRRAYGRSGNSDRKAPDAAQFERDQGRYSLRHGKNDYIVRGRNALEEIEGGMELLLKLVDFDPEKRATACDVLNSQFMIPLREDPALKRTDDPRTHATSFMAYATDGVNR